MMKVNNNKEDHFIDKYYDEIPQSNLTSKEEEFIEYKNKLDQSLEKMDIINKDDFNLDVNIFKIINEAEEIKLRKRNKLETLIFTSLSLIILLTGVFVILSFNVIYLVYIEIFITSLLTFLLISSGQSGRTQFL